jgi:hypothetical protein
MTAKAETRNKEELIQEEKTKNLNIGGGGCKGRKKADTRAHPARSPRAPGERQYNRRKELVLRKETFQ